MMVDSKQAELAVREEKLRDKLCAIGPRGDSEVISRISGEIVESRSQLDSLPPVDIRRG